MARAVATKRSTELSLIFRLGDERFGVAADKVAEVMRKPAITRVPYGPDALAGIANLRGAAIPVVSVVRLLGLAETNAVEQKLIVFKHHGLVGLLVDEVFHLDQSDVTGSTADIEAALESAFQVKRRPVAQRPEVPEQSSHGGSTAPQTEDLSFLVFGLAGQQFGLRIEAVHEVFTVPAAFSASAKADAIILGLLDFRDSVLPLISLARLLGLSESRHAASRRVIVTEYEGERIGLVVETIDAIRRLPQNAIDVVPAILKRGDGPAEIEAIGRADGGRTLISILSTEKLFGNQAVRQAVDQKRDEKPMSGAETDAIETEQFLIFMLGDEAYGLPIGAVDEVVSVSDAITRMPNAPDFVKGVMNLRGKPVPLIDQRLRFKADGGATAEKKPRAIVITIGRLQAGFVVDGVSEVVSIPVSALATAPDFSSDGAEVFDRVAQIETDGRMLLLIDPKELLTRAEQDLVSALRADASVAATKS